MRKILLACLMAFGISATAQIAVNETFESSPVPNFSISGGYQPNRYTDGGCNADNGGYGSNIYGTSASTTTVNMIYTKPAAITANGKKIDVSFDYSTYAFESVGGTITVAYMKANSGTTWTTLGTATIPVDNADTVCQSFTGTIPQSANVNGNFRLRIQAVTASASDDFYFFVDNVKIIQETVTPPACTTVTLPANGANPNNINSLTWSEAGGAIDYKVNVGTSTGSNDIVAGTNVTGTSYLLPTLAANTTYFVSVIPTNANGDATGCTEYSFTTGTSTYCNDATATATDHAGFEKISNVTFADINNASTATTGYEDFTSIVGTVEQGTSYPISVTISSYDSDLTSVWIDYNKDNLFSDSEKVNLAAAANATGNVSVPTDALLGNTRMRVRTTYVNAPNACGGSAYGQTEDYTINVVEKTLAVSNINKSKVSVYPNPFTDVLKISDVKGVKSVSVNDVSGRLVKTLAPSAELNLSSLKAGLYIVNLQMEDGTVKSVKAIKK